MQLYTIAQALKEIVSVCVPTLRECAGSNCEARSVTAVSLACYPHPPTQPLSRSLSLKHTHSFQLLQLTNTSHWWC